MLYPLQRGGYCLFENDESALTKISRHLRNFDKKKRASSNNDNVPIDIDDEDSSDDESSVQSSHVASSQKSRKYIQPREGTDVILSLTDERYKETMFRHFTKLGEKRKKEERGETIKTILNEFKGQMKSFSGKFVKVDGHTRISKKYYVVGEDEASSKIYDDVSRRMESSHQWLKKRGISDARSDKSPSKKRRETAAKSPLSSGSNFKTDDTDTDTEQQPSFSAGVVATGNSSNIVEMDHIIPVFNDIKKKLEATKSIIGKKFYGHLKRYIAQAISKNNGVKRSDFSNIQQFMSRFVPKINMLADANDLDEIIVYEGAIKALMKDCEKDLPLGS